MMDDQFEKEKKKIENVEVSQKFRKIYFIWMLENINLRPKLMHLPNLFLNISKLLIWNLQPEMLQFLWIGTLSILALSYIFSEMVVQHKDIILIHNSASVSA